jgi:hypothetical protein
MLTPRVKKILMLLVVIFIIFAVTQHPDMSAGAVHSALVKVGNGIQSVGHFFNVLFKK